MTESEYLPKWADDLSAVNEYIIGAHGRAANIPREGAGGRSVHIGIIDSACQLPDQLTNGYEVRQGPTHSFIDSQEDETTRHCTPVFDLMSSFCPQATFSIYQAVNSDRKLPIDAYSDAITRAIEDEVDILNISAGDPWPGPIAANPSLQETKRAIDEELIVVAAAGNWKTDQETRPPVHCPAALEDVIAVGGFLVDCPATIGEESDSENEGPYYIKKDPDYEYQEQIPEGPFCGERGCINGRGCIPNKVERSWERNPQPTGEKPDVLAPFLIGEKSPDGKYVFNGGTSFAAPIVTASLACILDELRRSEKHGLNAYQARQAVVNGASPIDEGKLPKFDAMGARRELGLA